MMTTTKIVLATSAVIALLATFAITRIPGPAPPVLDRSTPTIALEQLPFDTPSWVPDEATKKKALMLAYDITGTMNAYDGTSWYFSTHDQGSIDVSKILADRVITDRVTADAPAKASVDIADPNTRNVLDAQAEAPAKGPRKKR